MLIETFLSNFQTLWFHDYFSSDFVIFVHVLNIYNEASFLLQQLLYNWKLVFWQIWLQFSLTFQPSPPPPKYEKNVVTGMNCRLVIQSWMETWPCLIRDPFWYRKIHRMRTAALKSNNGEKYQEAKVIIPVDKRGWGWLLAGGKNSKKRSCRWIITNDDQSHFSSPKRFWGHWNFSRKKVVFWILSMQKMRLYCHFQPVHITKNVAFKVLNFGSLHHFLSF